MASSHWYGKALTHLAAGDWAWNDTFNIVAALMNGQYSPDEDADEIWDDISEYEVEGIAYTKTTLTLIDPIYLPTTREIWLGASNNITLEDSTLSARYLVLFVDSGVAETSYLIGWLDFGENKITQEADFVLNWNANGILRLRRS